LDLAIKTVTEIERLQNQKSPKPAQTATKPVTAVEPPKVTDLTNAELAQALELANRAGNSDTVKLCYAELNRRRGN
jgi:hypothetical protein